MDSSTALRIGHIIGLSLRNVQTGSLRQYVMFLVVGVIFVFLISSLF